MARDHARVKCSIWANPDWRALPTGAQWIYLHVLSSPNLNYAGVGDWRPKRIAAHSDGATGDHIENYAGFLETADPPFILIDRDTEEVLVRSFIRNDGLMASPNVAIAAVKAWQGVASEVLRGVIAWEMARLNADQPDLRAWDHKDSAQWLDGVLCSDVIDPRDAYLDLPPNPFWNPSENPSENPSGKGSVNPSGNPTGTLRAGVR